MRIPVVLRLVGACWCGAACGSSTGPGEMEVQGFYVTGFETSTFTPCGSEEGWFLIGPIIGEITLQYFETVTREFEPVYAEFAGELSPPGQYGPDPGFTHEFRATRVFTLRKVQPGDCGGVGPASSRGVVP